jgi:hypothetical protein
LSGRHGDCEKYRFGAELTAERKPFFAEEKNQKTFTFSAAPTSSAMAWISTLAQTQKSFGSFLQKRTFFLISCVPAPH